MNPEAQVTRRSIPTRLDEAGIPYEQTSDQMGALRYIIYGEVMTPGEAVTRHLSGDTDGPTEPLSLEDYRREVLKINPETGVREIPLRIKGDSIEPGTRIRFKDGDGDQIGVYEGILPGTPGRFQARVKPENGTEPHEFWVATADMWLLGLAENEHR